ncbi:unnamed protein product [Closterium sp. Yama58-4]|nr:unnamed protein product [Closterium sp. Yama58-4]
MVVLAIVLSFVYVLALLTRPAFLFRPAVPERQATALPQSGCEAARNCTGTLLDQYVYQCHDAEFRCAIPHPRDVEDSSEPLPSFFRVLNVRAHPCACRSEDPEPRMRAALDGAAFPSRRCPPRRVPPRRVPPRRCPPRRVPPRRCSHVSLSPPPCSPAIVPTRRFLHAPPPRALLLFWKDTGQRMRGREKGGRWTGYILEVTLHRWLNKSATNRYKWWHFMTLMVGTS